MLTASKKKADEMSDIQVYLKSKHILTTLSQEPKIVWSDHGLVSIALPVINSLFEVIASSNSRAS